jgi:choline dehydrogenase-like flavoprotein
MSNDGTALSGVTNHFGEVLTGKGSETHQGLVVTDGALIPTALGVNPFATITALAERAVKYMADQMELKIDYTTRNGRSAFRVHQTISPRL